MPLLYISLFTQTHPVNSFFVFLSWLVYCLLLDRPNTYLVTNWPLLRFIYSFVNSPQLTHLYYPNIYLSIPRAYHGSIPLAPTTHPRPFHNSFPIQSLNRRVGRSPLCSKTAHLIVYERKLATKQRLRPKLRAWIQYLLTMVSLCSKEGKLFRAVRVRKPYL
jgi:hypothetical protein